MTDLPPYPLEAKLDRFFADAPPLAPADRTGWARDDYLRLAEPMVRLCAGWQQPDGSILDGDVGSVQATTTPRYMAAVALAVGAGICEDLVESAVQVT